MALGAIGMLGWREIEASILLLPGLAAGFLAAPWLIRLMSARTIRACILAISAISGLALVFKN